MVTSNGLPYPDVTVSGTTGLTDTKGEKSISLTFKFSPEPKSISEPDGGIVTLEVNRDQIRQPIKIEVAVAQQREPIVASRPEVNIAPQREVNAADRQRPPRVQLGGNLFWSMEQRQFTESLGRQQAVGAVAKVGFSFRALEFSLEAGLPTRDAIDSELLTLASERRVLTDRVVSAVGGRPVRFGRRAELVPVGGVGLAFLNSHSYRYTVSGGSVVTAEQVTNSVRPAVTVGVDLRWSLVRRFQFVFSYRAHALFGESAVLASRPTIQLRPAAGIQWNVGGAQ